MDLHRIKELEKLAGLKLDPLQREQLLTDLVQLEEFVSRLPEISPEHISMPEAEKEPLPGPAVLSMDALQERANAPSVSGGFYQIPSSGERS